MLGQTLGDLAGQVRDPQGAVIVGARITITNNSTNAARTTESNASGVYSFPALLPGTYSIRVDKTGFKTVTLTDVLIQVQAEATVDVEMPIGQISEVVEVNAQAASLSTENSTLGTVVENKRIVELPLNGRNYLQLVSLAPNVSFGFPSAGQAGSRQGGDRSNQSISVAGMRNNYNRYTLDGVENTDPNFNTYVIFPPVDVLLEFKVQSGIYPAEFGRGATQINVSTKGGGNQFHGAAYEFIRNEKFDAKNYAFTTARPAKDPFKWNQFGFALGGPVIIPKLFNGRNKLFFMSNYEWFRQRRNVQGVFTVPSSAMRGGNFNEIAGGIYDPNTRANINGTVTGTQFPGNLIPAERLQATSKQLLEFLPLPNVAGAGLRNNYVSALGRPINKDQFTQRFDFTESSRSNWFGRYSRSDENELNEAIKMNGTKLVTLASQWMASNTRVLTTTLVNEFRFGYTKFYNTTGPELAFTRDVVSELNIPGLKGGPPVQWGIPGESLDRYSFFGNDSEGPYENNNSALQFIDNLSWVRGKHTLKFGGEVRRDAYNQVGNQFARGNFTFTTQATRRTPTDGASGDAFADFMLGQIYQSEAAVSIASAQFRATSLAFYVDDTWKVTNRLTLSLGLRYEYSPPWEDQTGKLFNGIVREDIKPDPFNPVVQDRSRYPYFMRQGASRQDCYEGIAIRWVDIEVRCDGSLGNRLVGIDKNDWAPRFGVAYQATQHTVIRGGAGMFYSQDTGNPRFDMARNLAGRLRANPDTQYPNLNWQNALASIAGGTAQIARPYTFANPYDRRTPYTMQYMFNVQHELPGQTVVEAGFVGSISHHLEQLRAVNETLPACPGLPAPTDPNYQRCLNDPLRGRTLADRSPFPNFGRIQLVDNGGNGNYNSLGAKVTKRFSQGVTFLTSYTWAKAIDTGSAIRTQGGDTLFTQNGYCRKCDRGRSSFDTRQRFVTSALWDLPFGKGRKFAIDNGFANALFGGWQIGGILTLQSGFPISMFQGGDPSNTGGLFDRPTSTGVNADLPRGQQDPQKFFNTSAFTRTQPGLWGNVGRNTLNSPGIIAFDFSTLKDFVMPYAEGHRLQFRFEAFNLPNHPNWGNPDINIISSTFGVLTSTRTNMRNLQFALKYIF